MRYTDGERVKKIYKYALELQEYITIHQVQGDDLLENKGFAVACYYAAIQHG